METASKDNFSKNFAFKRVQIKKKRNEAIVEGQHGVITSLFFFLNPYLGANDMQEVYFLKCTISTHIHS